MTLSETILNLVSQLQNLDFELFAKYCAGYIGILWFITTLWIFFDARQRYPKMYQAILITFVTSVPILGFPFLILYVVMRPEHTKYEFEILSGLQKEWSMKKALPMKSATEQRSLPLQSKTDENIDLSKMTKKERRRFVKQNRDKSNFENKLAENSEEKIASNLETISSGISEGEIVKGSKLVNKLKSMKSKIPAINLRFK